MARSYPSSRVAPQTKRDLHFRAPNPRAVHIASFHLWPIILASQIMDESERYPWSTLYRVDCQLKGRPYNTNRSAQEQKGPS